MSAHVCVVTVRCQEALIVAFLAVIHASILMYNEQMSDKTPVVAKSLPALATLYQHLCDPPGVVIGQDMSIGSHVVKFFTLNFRRRLDAHWPDAISSQPNSLA